MEMQLFWLNFFVLFIFILPAQFNADAQQLSSKYEKQTNETDSKNLPTLRRGKRYLDFTKGSRMSWRTTVKNNILKVNTLWGYGFGFRANFPFPDKADRRRPFFKRDVFQSLTDVLDGNGLDGQACILKSFCTAHLDGDSEYSSGMLFKLLKYIFTLNDDEKRHFPYLKHENCHQILHSHCPLSFNNISPFTDDV
ncbi:hypothetical protein FF38_03973 [Lucilia cuprina]|uniref:Uncharacterized protein n=1 Tax=Lucilia cuprina TaxID=7375 RepID=A0A0L0BR93_LUCCU|nr:hypothetical protein CVS40_7245 [Lucilia cuprina]KNC21749.1 hypothetical protein FF38_03973 [Lucilia cuprina]